MPSRAIRWAFVALVLGAPALAQQPPQPYAGFQIRPIKTLSADELTDLSAGRGMGFALAAELNGYPGPLHVLELADPLGLTDDQRTAVKQEFERMREEAIPLGQSLIAAERDLDRQFAERTITPERLKATTARIAEIRGELRATHLKFHISTATLLRADQIRRYADERGYTSGGAPAAHTGSTHPRTAHDAQHHSRHQHTTAPRH